MAVRNDRRALRRHLSLARGDVLAVHDPLQRHVAMAAAPEASLSFLFWGAGLFVLPVIGAYTAAVYLAFRGKQRAPPRS